MAFIALWIGVIIFGLGAIFSLLSAIRTLQISRRWSDYRLRRRYVVQARGSVLVAVLSGALAIVLLVFGRLWQPTESPAPLPATSTPVLSETAPPLATVLPIETPTLPANTPTNVITPSPIILPTSTLTATPAMPIAVQAMIQGTVTPAFDIEFGRLRFSTEINNYTLVSPGETFRNPIKQMYSVFTYLPIGVKVEWTGLWYQNGELKYVDTTSWKDFAPGVAVAGWLRPAPEWEAGEYEVQIFVGTDWQASGRFALQGEPPTATASPPATDTATLAPTATVSKTPTITLTATSTAVPSSTPVPKPTSTPAATATRKSSLSALPTPVSTATQTPRPTPTRTPMPTASLTAEPTASFTALPSPTRTQAPTATSTYTAKPPPTSTATATTTHTPRPTETTVPSNTPTRTPTPSTTPTPPPVRVNVHFTNTRPSGTSKPPFDGPVARDIPGSANPIAGALDEYFVGPTIEEQARGLVALRNGFVGYRRVEFVDGVVSVYLSGNCQPTGTGYSIAQPLIATLKQFPGVLYVKIFDAYDHTGDASSTADSWPVCLDVIFTSTSTPPPTRTPTSTPSLTPTASPVPTRTPTATVTFAPRPTRTPVPTKTFTPIPSTTPAPTRTPLPTATARPLPTPTAVPPPTSTPLPRRTSIPTATQLPTPTRTSSPRPTATGTQRPAPTSTPKPTLTPSSTYTPGPTNTPRPTLTLTPINAPTRVLLTTPLASATAAATGSPTSTLDATCNRAEFLGDVTIFDNATLRPGEPFRKTWRIQNAGNCPWTAAYKLVFVRGDQMDGPDFVPLPGLVVSGQTADVSVDLAAPAASGQYQGYWKLQTPDGTTFGMGPAATGTLWVTIRAVGEAIPTATAATSTATATAVTPTAWAEATLTAFVATETAEAALAAPSPTPQILLTPAAVADFANNACAAQWQANDGMLVCPGQDGDPRGTVSVLSQATLEDGTTVSQLTLLTIPSSSPDGYILGLYPQYQVQAGDRFQAEVGCEHNADLCSVLFRVSYLDETGAAHDLWTLGEFYDGHYFDLDLDLSDLAGQQVRFVLSVNDLGSSTGDRALWVAPRLVRLPAPTPAARRTPSSTPAATPTATQAPTPTLVFASPTPTVPVETPAAPIPQFINSVLEFFRRLFGAP